MSEPSQIMADWEAYVLQYGQRVIIEDAWTGPVQWEGAPDGSDWFFVMGPGHCGSSVLAEMLSLHPDVHCANEDGTVTSLLGLLSTKTVITRDCDIIHWQNGPWSGKARPFASETRQVTGGYLRALCETWRDYYGHGKLCVGDKGVKCYIHRDQLRKVFPDCRFLYCVRHPLDQLSGLLNDDWRGNRAMAQEPKAAWEQVRMYVRMWRRVCREEDVLAVKYEHFADLDTLAATLAVCYQHIGADPAAAKDIDFSRFVSAAGVERWRKDKAVCDLLDIWEHLRMMTADQREALTQPPDFYLDALADGEWAM